MTLETDSLTALRRSPARSQERSVSGTGRDLLRRLLANARNLAYAGGALVLSAAFLAVALNPKWAFLAAALLLLIAGWYAALPPDQGASCDTSTGRYRVRWGAVVSVGDRAVRRRLGTTRFRIRPPAKQQTH
jgi:hypothetical protein